MSTHFRHPLSPEPDINSGMAALQMVMSPKETPSRGSPAPGTPKMKPTIPQKNKSIDEYLRLKKELEEVKEARDLMEDDLLKAQEDLEEREKELKQKSREVWTWREKAEKLSNEMVNERRHQGQGQRSPMSANASALASREASARNEKELAEARQQIQELTAALSEAKTHLSAKESDSGPSGLDQESLSRLEDQIGQLQIQCRSEEKLRRAAEASLQNTSQFYQNKLESAEAQARIQIEDQRRQIQELQTEGGLQRMDIDSGGNEELERLRRLTAEQEGRIEEHRRCAEQFRSMSERLTSQVKQGKQSEQNMRQQIETMKTQMSAARQGSNIMPGAFQRG